MTAARAWPSFRVETGLRLTNISSRATSSGSCLLTTAATPSNNSSNRCDRLSLEFETTTPLATCLRGIAFDIDNAPACAPQSRIQPHQPGCHGGIPCSASETFQDIVINLEV